MDETIVELFWERKESAIEQTEQQYGGYLQKIAHNRTGDGSKPLKKSSKIRAFAISDL